MMKKRAQQEMVGFVLIVVLVVVAMMIFLVITLKKPAIAVDSRVADNLLSSVLAYTTECIVREPNMETIRDLVGSCYENRECKNFDMDSCDYLNESLTFMMKDLIKTESGISAYEIDIFWESEDEETRQPLIFIKDGICNLSSGGKLEGKSEDIYADDGSIKVFLNICGENN